MFDFVRSHTRLFLGMLVLLIIPSFVFFGVQGYSSFNDSKTATVAQVAGQAIKANELEAAHRQQIERVRQ
jgi:peptidyl-prolyl cis-trans isomerase D